MREQDDIREILTTWERNGSSRAVRKREGDSRYIEALMFIPLTPENNLKRRLTIIVDGLPFETEFK